MSGRVIPASCTLAFHHVEVTETGRAYAVMNDGTMLCFDTAADVDALIEGLAPLKARLLELEAREAAGMPA
jgi:hypothetical protein